jgi:nitroreductase
VSDDQVPVEELVRRACRAPSVHNTQPWRWRASGSRIDLYADYTRQLVYADPGRRDLMISCGAALHHLQAAAAALGWAARVRRVPNPTDERLLASAQLRETAPAPDAAEVLAAIEARRTDRRRPSSAPVSSAELHALAAAGSAWGAQVRAVDGDVDRVRLRELTERAGTVQSRNLRYLEELEAWTSGSDFEGIPGSHLPEPPSGPLARARGRNRPAFDRFPGHALADSVRQDAAIEGVLLVCTSSDDAISRIRAGEALSALWLAATRQGLSVVPFSQALEVEETRRLVQQDVLDDLAFAQVLLRVGRGSEPAGTLPPTPRRLLEDVLTRY